MIGKRFIPGKYVIIGAILLTLFSIIPIIYTVTIAFTNYSTGHIGTKEEAIAAIEQNSLSETENSQQYSMLPLYAESSTWSSASPRSPPDTDRHGDDGHHGAPARAVPARRRASRPSSAESGQPRAGGQSRGERADGVRGGRGRLGVAQCRGHASRGRRRHERDGRGARGRLATHVHRHQRGSGPRAAGRRSARRVRHGHGRHRLRDGARGRLPRRSTPSSPRSRSRAPTAGTSSRRASRTRPSSTRR